MHVKVAIEIVRKLQANQQLPSGKESRKGANGTAADAADELMKRKPENSGGGKPAKLADKALKDENTKSFKERAQAYHRCLRCGWYVDDCQCKQHQMRVVNEKPESDTSQFIAIMG